MNLLRPTRTDIKQIETLAKLGCNRKDIAQILLITDAKLERWEKNNSEVSHLLKAKAQPEYNMNHPDYAPMVEEAFTCAGKRFYRFKEEFRMPTGRYKYYYAYLREVDLRMSMDKLVEFTDAFELILNGGEKGKGINMGKIWELVLNIKSRVKLAFEPQGVRNLAAVAYFDETEDLTSFNMSYGRDKIALWDSHGIHDFFLTKPIGELLNLNKSSTESLLQYLNQAETILMDLNSGLLKVSEENSSESGKKTL
jgi:hypothetical protein